MTVDVDAQQIGGDRSGDLACPGGADIEGRQEIVGLGSGVEPAIEVGLCGGGQSLAVGVEPGQEVQGDGDLGADVGGGVPGDRPAARSIAGPSHRLPGCEGPQQFRVVFGLFAQQVVEPDVDAVEQFGAFGKDSGVDEQVSGSVQGITLRISIEEFVGDGLRGRCCSSLRERCDATPSASRSANSVERRPWNDRPPTAAPRDAGPESAHPTIPRPWNRDESNSTRCVT
jgi:hypothetical protein